MKKIKFILPLVLILVLLVGCTKPNADRLGVGLPDGAEDTVIAYFEASKQGAAECIKYVYFADEGIRGAFLASQQLTVDYRVESAKKVNDNLYALTVLHQTNYTEGAYERVYNFVGLIDGRWYFMNGVGQIPDELKENFDKDDYTYNNPSFL